MLEIGCGNGRDAIYFSSNGINVTAIDRCPVAISKCKERYGNLPIPTEKLYGHYRRFIIKDELIDNLKNAGFNVLHEVESNNLAISGNDNPVVIRITAVKE